MSKHKIKSKKKLRKFHEDRQFQKSDGGLQLRKQQLFMNYLLFVYFSFDPEKGMRKVDGTVIKNIGNL